MAANRVEVVQWGDIADHYTSSLIVGNGGSVAVAPTFAYSSLFQAASDSGHLNGGAAEVFARFKTEDFELVLRRLWHATLVNEALEIEAGPAEVAYSCVREALIRTIRDTHPSYDDALPHLTPIYGFMRHFDTVISLNYDLIVYWAAMLGNQQLGNWFKDGFRSLLFQENWRAYRQPYHADGTTMFFYPHGNMALARTSKDREIKIVAQGQGRDLLNTILDRWEAGTVSPLFVCEGTSRQKEVAIGQSSYLHTVLDGPMSEKSESVVIYGWALNDQDAHIIEAIRASQPTRIAVSVHQGNQELIDRALRLLTPVADEVQFFDSASPGSWNRPE